MADLKKWVGVSILLLTLILVSGFYIQRKSAQVADQKQFLADQNLAREFLDSLQLQAAEAEKYLAELESIFPAQEPKEAFIKNLESLAQKRNLNVLTDFIQSVAGGELRPSFSDFQSTISGSYNNIVNFLKDLEAGQFLVKFNNIGIEQKNKSFEAVINGQIFYE